jgi:tetratricopeptide (TPR) repeat protein
MNNHKNTLKFKEGEEYLKNGKIFKAKEIFLKILSEDNKNFIIHWYLGHIFFKLHKYLKAISYIEKFIKLKKKDLLNLNFLGEIYIEINQFEKAINLFKEALKFEDTNKTVLNNLAKTYLQIGDFKESKIIYEKLLKEDPLNSSYHYSLLRLDINYKRKKQSLAFDKNNVTNNIYYNLILAKQYQQDKDYNLELKHLIEAHQSYLKQKENIFFQQFNYYTNLLPSFVEKIRNLKKITNDELQPIFILGLPRSGTTLVEKIINSGHANKFIESTGESDCFDKIFYSNQYIQNYESPHLVSNFDFSDEGLYQIKSDLMDQYYQQGLAKDKIVFTDKSISNLLYIEIINKIFPNAKFIYCKRNLIANTVGILRTFLPEIYWSHSIEKVFSISKIYAKKIKQIKLENKTKILEIEIENLSENPIGVSKNIYDYLNFKWTPDCIDNNIKNFVIKTASDIQVRKPIKKHDLSHVVSFEKIFKDLGYDYLD